MQSINLDTSFSDLPISRYLDAIVTSFKLQNNLVLQAEPGAGKSTLVPLALLQSKSANSGKIIMLEPRRMAAKSIASYLAAQLKEPVGKTIGYRIKNETRVSPHTQLEIITEGILTRMLQDDPELTGIEMLIFDEFHERSIHADLALMLSKEVQQSIRDDLKLLVMSATIDTNMVANYVENAAIITCPGRTFPVETLYRAPSAIKLTNHGLTQAVLSAIEELMQLTQGDILVFLPGINEINQCLECVLTSVFNHETTCLPLHGSLPLEQQEQVLKRTVNQKRKIIFTTNIAETSLTIEGITGVIDSGLERALRYDPNSGMTRLETRRISKASAEQRKGRAGRLSNGHCIRLWSESTHQALIDYQAEEILNADLCDTVLNLANWGNTDFDSIDWLTAPPKPHFDASKALLLELGLLSKDGKITKLGQQAAQLPLPPRLAKLLLVTTNQEQHKLACTLAAMLAERDILTFADSTDLALRLELVNSPVKTLKERNAGVRINTIQAIKSTQLSLSKSTQPQKRANIVQLPEEITNQDDLLAALLLLVFPERLAKRRGLNVPRYVLANGKGVSLDISDPLCQHEWLVVSNCDMREREGKIFNAVPISTTLIKSVFSEMLREVSKEHFDSNTGSFSCSTALCYYTLPIQQLNKGAPSKAFISATCGQLLIDKGKILLNWTNACEKWLKRLIWLGSVNDNFPSFTEQQIFSQANEWLMPYVGTFTNIQALKKVDILPLLKAVISWEQSNVLDRLAPETYLTPSGKQVPIVYDEDQGPTVSVQLQEMFGETQSPKLANAVNLRFELLSPARRPIQITSDLEQFWVTSYFDVAKEMRAKYPKHRWPEKPLEEKPGHSLKQKKK